MCNFKHHLRLKWIEEKASWRLAEASVKILYIHALTCVSVPEVPAAPSLWMWPRSPRLWAMWRGHPPKELGRTSPPLCPHAERLSATLWTLTAWWDASPVAPTTASTWRPSAARGTCQSAHIKDSQPVRTNTCIYTHKNIYMDTCLRVWSDWSGWSWKRLNIWAHYCVLHIVCFSKSFI